MACRQVHQLPLCVGFLHLTSCDSLLARFQGSRFVLATVSGQLFLQPEWWRAASGVGVGCYRRSMHRVHGSVMRWWWRRGMHHSVIRLVVQWCQRISVGGIAVGTMRRGWKAWRVHASSVVVGGWWRMVQVYLSPNDRLILIGSGSFVGRSWRYDALAIRVSCSGFGSCSRAQGTALFSILRIKRRGDLIRW